MEDFLWENPDVSLEHLACFDGVQVVPEAQWKRSREWDNVLGYYEPATRRIMLHAQTLEKARDLPSRISRWRWASPCWGATSPASDGSEMAPGKRCRYV